MSLLLLFQSGGNRFVKSLSDTFNTSDILVRLVNYHRTESDTFTTGNVVARVYVAVRNVSNSSTTSDSVNRVVHFVRTELDVFTTTASFQTNTRQLNEFFNTIDTIGREVNYHRGTSEVFTFSDLISYIILTAWHIGERIHFTFNGATGEAVINEILKPADAPPHYKYFTITVYATNNWDALPDTTFNICENQISRITGQSDLGPRIN